MTAKELLADVNEELDVRVRLTEPAERRMAMLEVLERRLLGLLEAGQTMAESIAADGGNQKALEMFVAAKAKAVAP